MTERGQHDHSSAGPHDHAVHGCPSCARYSHLGRRRFVELLGLGVAAVLAGCTSPRGPRQPAAAPIGNDDPGTTTTASLPDAAITVQLDRFPGPHPGPPKVVFHGPAGTEQIAITIDDGSCQPCVDAYVAFAQSSGVHITFSPNGIYKGAWDPHTPTLRRLIETGQVQLANHTYSHRDLKRMPDAQIRADLERNEAWIQSTFGITTRPWFRPPFGFHDARVDAAAGTAGYTKVLMWNGSYGDATLLTPDALMTEARKYLKPGVVMLGHANHPTVTELFGQITDLLRTRGLTPVTLDEMFGTSRAHG